MPPKEAAEAKLAGIKPTGIKTWVRIRPLASEGEKGGHSEGETVAKQLGAFDEKAVQIVSHDQGGKSTSYGYPSKVFPVDCTQEDVANDILPGLLSACGATAQYNAPGLQNPENVNLHSQRFFQPGPIF